MDTVKDIDSDVVKKFFETAMSNEGLGVVLLKKEPELSNAIRKLFKESLKEGRIDDAQELVALFGRKLNKDELETTRDACKKKFVRDIKKMSELLSSLD